MFYILYKFYKNKKSKDGVRSSCIECGKKYILSNSEKIKEQNKTYNQKKYSIPLLYGKPGCGKSMISILLCNELLKTKKSDIDTKDIQAKIDLMIKILTLNN